MTDRAGSRPGSGGPRPGGEPNAAGAPPVVVTGIGSVSALGIGDGASTGRALATAVPGIGPVRAFSAEGCGSRLAGEVGSLEAHLPADEARRLPRVSQFAVVAARLAMADAALELVEPGAFGLVVGSSWGDLRSSEAFAGGFLARGPLGLSPLVFPSTVMNAMAAHVAIAVGTRGPMLTMNDAGAAGELAVARGAALVRAGRATAVLVGGADELSATLYRELAGLRAISPRGVGPEGCRPFDRDANGTVLGEGATFLVLEAEPVAVERGARIYAEVAGVAWGNLPARPGGVPLARGREPAVIRRAAAAAGLREPGVDLACLTGSAVPALDACELDLLAGALGPALADAWLTALTSLAGEHAGLGAMRAGAAALALAGHAVPPLRGLERPIRAGLRFVGSGPPEAPAPPRTALVHGLARGGTEVALLLRARALGGRPAA